MLNFEFQFFSPCFYFCLNFVAEFIYLNGRPEKVLSIDIFILCDQRFDAECGSIIDFYCKYITQKQAFRCTEV
jgi:hypothetical protein